MKDDMGYWLYLDNWLHVMNYKSDCMLNNMKKIDLCNLESILFGSDYEINMCEMDELNIFLYISIGQRYFCYSSICAIQFKPWWHQLYEYVSVDHKT